MSDAQDIHAIRTHSRETIRTARYAMLGAEPQQAKRIWFALHGYGQLAPRFLRAFQGLVPDDTCVVAPEGLNRFYSESPRPDGGHLQRVGATWMTREAREADIADTMRWLNALHADLCGERRDQPIGVLGFSQGVATALRWIATGQVKPDAFVVWAGGLATDAEPSQVQAGLSRATVTLVAGDNDPLVPQQARHDALSMLRTFQPNTRDITFGGGHTLDAAVLAELLNQLQRQPSD